LDDSQIEYLYDIFFTHLHSLCCLRLGEDVYISKSRDVIKLCREPPLLSSVFFPLVCNLGAIHHMVGGQWRRGFECVICCLHCIMFNYYTSGSIFSHSVHALSHERGPGNGSRHAFRRKRVRFVVLQMISNYLYI